jgi:hypothetical protein
VFTFLAEAPTVTQPLVARRRCDAGSEGGEVAAPAHHLESAIAVAGGQKIARLERVRCGRLNDGDQLDRPLNLRAIRVASWESKCSPSAVVNGARAENSIHS